jgi:hypothetical protein
MSSVRARAITSVESAPRATLSAGATLEQRIVGIALADQVGASLAMTPTPLSVPVR